MQIVPHRCCHISTKMSVLWPSQYAKIRFQPGLPPYPPRWGAHDAPPDPLVGWRGDHSPYPTPFGTNPPSALAIRPPRIPARSTHALHICTSYELEDHRVKVKVTSKKVENAYDSRNVKLPQAKVGNLCCCIAEISSAVHGNNRFCKTAMEFACSMGFWAMGDWKEWPPSLSRDR